MCVIEGNSLVSLADEHTG